MRERIVISTDDGQLGFPERAISVVLGLGLAAAAAKPRPNMVLNLLALAAGSYLAWRGATGRDPLNTSVLEDRT
jgi:uncharacterized membrane protein